MRYAHFPMHELRKSALLFVVTLAASCAQNGAPATTDAPKGSASAPAAKDVIATANGAPITKLDVVLRLKADSHSKAELTPERTKVVLETLVKQELAAQRAASLGLDADPKYQDGLRQLQAQVDAYRRKELAEAYFRHEVDKKSPVTDDEAKAYFDANAPRLRTQLHVLQLLMRSEAAITKAAAQLEQGQSFDDVAKANLPVAVPGERKPWDLGFLAWHRLPPPWRSVIYDLPVGKPSGIIKGPNDRFWIVQVVERREDPAADFGTFKDAIKADLRAVKAEQLREKAEAELLEKGKVTYTISPVSMPEQEE